MIHASAAQLQKYTKSCSAARRCYPRVYIYVYRIFQVSFSARSWTCSRTSVGRLVLLPAEGKSRTCSGTSAGWLVLQPAEGDSIYLNGCCAASSPAIYTYTYTYYFQSMQLPRSYICSCPAAICKGILASCAAATCQLPRSYSYIVSCPAATTKMRRKHCR